MGNFFKEKSIAVVCELFSDFCDFRLVRAFACHSRLANALLVPSDGAFPALAFHLGDQLLLPPTHLGGQVSQSAELAEVTQLDAPHGIRHADFFLGVVGSGNSLENFETTHGDSAAGGLVRDHAADSAPEDPGRRAVVNEGAGGVG